jgi:hypothetical protein
LHEVALGFARIAERPDAKAVALAQRAGDGNDAMLVQRQKLMPDLLPAPLKGHAGDFFV